MWEGVRAKGHPPCVPLQSTCVSQVPASLCFYCICRGAFVVLQGDAAELGAVCEKLGHSQMTAGTTPLQCSFWEARKQLRPTRAGGGSLIPPLPKHNNAVLSICDHSTSTGSFLSAFHLLQYCRANAIMYNSNFRLNATLIADETEHFFFSIGNIQRKLHLLIFRTCKWKSLFLLFIHYELSNKRIKVSVCPPSYSYIQVFRPSKEIKSDQKDSSLPCADSEGC